MKKILIVTSTFPKDASDVVTARFVFDLASALTGYFDVSVLCQHSPRLKEYSAWGKLKIYRFKYFWPEKMQLLSSGRGMLNDLKANIFACLQIPFFLIAQRSAAQKIIKAEGIEIVNSHWLVPSGLSSASIKKKLNFKHIVTIHAADVFLLKNLKTLGKQLAKYIIRKSDYILPVSSYINDQTQELTSTLITRRQVIPMGVNSDFTGKTPKNRDNNSSMLRLFFAGKLIEKKGLIYLLQALKFLNDKEISLKIAGGGPLENELKKYVKDNSLCKRVEFLGWVANNKLAGHILEADLLVVPSIIDRRGETEGMPVVILEAMALSKPVLASDVSGIADIVKDDFNGWLTIPKDAKSISDKLIHITQLTNMDYYAQNALNTAKEYEYPNIAYKYAQIFNEA